VYPRSKLRMKVLVIRVDSPRHPKLTNCVSAYVLGDMTYFVNYYAKLQHQSTPETTKKMRTYRSSNSRPSEIDLPLKQVILFAGLLGFASPMLIQQIKVDTISVCTVIMIVVPEIRCLSNLLVI
jgi:hypothetical protein